MEKKNKLKNHLGGFNKILRYTSMAIEMAAIIGGGAYAGVWLDRKLDFDTPIFTIALSLFGVFASTYLIIKQVTNDK